MSTTSAGTKYHDVKLFLWLIPSINIVNYFLAGMSLAPRWLMLVMFAIDTTQGYIAWLIVRSIILWLDKKISYEIYPARRIVIQLILTIFVGCVSIFILTTFVNFLVVRKPVPRSFYIKDMVLSAGWFFVVNIIYTLLYYHHKRQQDGVVKKGS